MILISITGAGFTFAIDAIKPLISRAILVFDNTPIRYEHLALSCEMILHGNDQTMGSYYSRNLALRNTCEGDVILMIDDDVKIVELPNRVPPKGTLYVPHVVVSGIPKTALELWYKYNAFNQKKFIKTGFAPTICWLFIRDSSYEVFDGSKLASGDILASRHFEKITLLDSFKIETKLRNDQKIRKKLERQTIGNQLLGPDKKSRMLRIIKNIFFGNGLSTLPQCSNKIRYIYACYRAGWLKAFFSVRYFFKTEPELKNILINVNKREREND